MTAKNAANARGIQSFETGVAVFRKMLGFDRPCALGELSLATGLAPSLLHRYCASLVRTGLARRDDKGGYIADLQAAWRGGEDPQAQRAIAFLHPRLPAIVAAIGETVFVSVWGVSGPRIVHVEEADRPVSVRPNLRGDLKILDSATGRAFAAHLDRDRVLAIVAAERAALPSAEAAGLQRRFAKALVEARRYGLARSIGERYAGLASLSAPVCDKNGRAIVAVTSFGLTPSFDSSWNGAVAQALRALAVETRAALAARRKGALDPAGQDG